MRKFLLKLLMGASLTTSVFIFQACYGTPVPPPESPEGLEVSQVDVQAEVKDVVGDEAATPIVEEIPSAEIPD